MLYLKKLMFVLFISITVMSCGDDETENNDNNVLNQVKNEKDQKDQEKPQKKLEETKVVCIWKAVSLKETPSAKGKYVTTMYLGETGKTYNKTVKDTLKKGGRVYLQITLADGTQGWIQNNLVAVDVVPNVTTAKTKLYRRPDLVATSGKDFDEMQYVVVLETMGDWAKIKGKKHANKWFSEGWVKVNKLSNNEEDILVALLYEKAQYISDKAKKIEALRDITSNSDFSNSRWLDRINTEIEEIQTSIDEQSSEHGLEKPAKVVDATED